LFGAAVFVSGFDASLAGGADNFFSDDTDGFDCGGSATFSADGSTECFRVVNVPGGRFIDSSGTD